MIDKYRLCSHCGNELYKGAPVCYYCMEENRWTFWDHYSKNLLILLAKLSVKSATAELQDFTDV
jgi:hypothetical protein